MVQGEKIEYKESQQVIKHRGKSVKVFGMGRAGKRKVESGENGISGGETDEKN